MRVFRLEFKIFRVYFELLAIIVYWRLESELEAEVVSDLVRFEVSCDKGFENV